MSIMRCDGCDRMVDTDKYDMEHNDAGSFCEACQDRHLEEGRALAAEHHRDLNAQGCTCQWVGANGDPDQHIKRDKWCPMHGIDPDAVRDYHNEPPE